EHAGDGRAGGLVELVDVHEGLRGLAHRLEGFRPQHGAAVARGGPGAVNDRAHAELLVDRGNHARPSSFIARIAVSNAARVSAMTSSVWQVPTSARAPLKSTPLRMRAWRSARLCSAFFASRRRQSTSRTDWSDPSRGGASAPK